MEARRDELGTLDIVGLIGDHPIEAMAFSASFSDTDRP